MNNSAPNPPSPVHDVFPYLCVRGAEAAIDFYTKAFAAVELFRIQEPSGRIGHAQLKLGPAVIMLSDEYPDHGINSPLKFGGTGVTIHLHVDNVDALANKAVQLGATMLMEPTDQPHGERQCRLQDPFGHIWLLGHEVEQVSPEEMQRRYQALARGQDAVST
jgi:uncharacterized glyoxalase superfamily protein PhnB